MNHLRNLLGAVKLVWRSAPGLTSASIVLVVIRSSLPLAMVYLMKLLVDGVTGASTAPERGEALHYLFWLIGITAGLALFRAMCDSCASVIRSAQSEKVTDSLHSIMHSKTSEVDLDCYENPDDCDKLHRAQEEMEYRPGRILDGLIDFARNSISLIFMAGLVFSFDWLMAVILLGSCIPQAVARSWYGAVLHRWYMDRTPEFRRVWVFHWMLTVAVYAKEIRNYLLGTIFKNRYRTLRDRLRVERLRIVTRRALADFLGSTISTGVFFAAYGVIVYRTVVGSLSLGDMVMYFQAFQLAQEYFQGMMRNIAELFENNLFLSSFFAFLARENVVVNSPHPRPLPSMIERGIVFDRVSFAYPSGNHNVLNQVTLKVGPGEIVAIVGENGSGKTTLAKLLCRFYDPSEGSISLDNTDIREFDLTEWWQNVGVMFQDYAKYAMTANENIWFGAAYLPMSRARVVEAARQSGADEAIERLEHGYETLLSKTFEDGDELSMGEWQKVALARCLYKKARIFLLDEPTNSMDTRSEARFFKNLRRLTAGRATILMSHRLPTVRVADYIYVLDDGRIVESGTHGELIRAGGKYAYLFESEM